MSPEKATALTGESPPNRALQLDVAAAIGCFIFAMVTLRLDLDDGSLSREGWIMSGQPSSWWAYPAATAACAALLTRRRIPLAVLIFAGLCRLLLTWDVGHEIVLPVTTLAFYTATRHGQVGAATRTAPIRDAANRFGERATMLALVATLATVLAIGTTALEDDPFLPEFLGEWVINLLPIAVADAVRSRADRLQILIDGEAEKRVQAERLNIARDLHDVVAHGLSTISVQSGVAAHLLERDPENVAEAAEALQIINATGRKSLDELRAMVGVLRSPDGSPLLPTPADPNDLADVVSGATAAGVAVNTNVSGTFPVDTGESCIVAVHRIVQEALTNVARHAGAVSAEVNLNHGEHEVEITVTNQPEQRSNNANNANNANNGKNANNGGLTSTGISGVGIIGMTERAESLGGTLTAGPTPEGGFQVASVLPYNPQMPHL